MAPVYFQHWLHPKLQQEIKFSQIIVIVLIMTHCLSVSNKDPVFNEGQVASVLFY